MSLHPVPKPPVRPKKAPRGLKRSRLKTRGQRRFPGRENPAALEAIRTLLCAVCSHLGYPQRTPTEVEHWVTKARGGYDVGDTFPTCADHREMRHRLGDQEFQRLVNVDADTLCAWTCRWLCKHPGVLASAVERGGRPVRPQPEKGL